MHDLCSEALCCIVQLSLSTLHQGVWCAASVLKLYKYVRQCSPFCDAAVRTSAHAVPQLNTAEKAPSAADAAGHMGGLGAGAAACPGDGCLVDTDSTAGGSV